MATCSIFHNNNLDVLSLIEDGSVDMIYIDPPFNTGKRQARGELVYQDAFTDFQSFITPRMQEAFRLLKPSGSLFFHLDYREIHYCKVWLDQIFGRDCFMNEIIWAYDYGARSRKKWSTKHDTILWYVKDPENYTFNYDEIERIPYMAPELVGAEKAARGKTPTDVWWNTIVPTMGKEKTGYPTQKPLGILERLVRVHSNENDTLLDFFAGSGSFGEAALKWNRNVTLIDQNPQAIEVMRQRLAAYQPEVYA